METLVKIFDILNNRITVPVAIFCITLLAIPENISIKMGLNEFVVVNKGILWLLILFSIFFYSYEKAKKYLALRKEKMIVVRRQEEIKGRMISNLSGLTSQEQAWIYYCLKNNVRTLNATAINPTAISLVNKLIVNGPNTQYDITNVPFTIRSDAWHHLLENRNAFCPQKYLSDAEHNRAVNDFIRSLRNIV